jgi:hypothetical protein
LLDELEILKETVLGHIGTDQVVTLGRLVGKYMELQHVIPSKVPHLC